MKNEETNRHVHFTHEKKNITKRYIRIFIFKNNLFLIILTLFLK